MKAALHDWRTSLAAFTLPRVRSMLLLGFSAGLPFALVLTTLGARLHQSGIDRTTIGYFSWVGLAYSLKFFWSPVVDRLVLPGLGRLGRRRSWMLLAQCCVAVGLLAMAWYDPARGAPTMALLAAMVAFAAATQDIAVDAWRIEAAEPEYQGTMAAAYQIGYRLALIVTGAGALSLAAAYGWSISYGAMAVLMSVGIATTLAIHEPEPCVDRATLAQEARVIAFLERSAHWPPNLRHAAAWLIGAVVCPFVDFFTRNGLRAALFAIALVCTFRLNYSTMGVMANPFYLDLGFSLKQIALISKGYGVVMTLTGAVIAGLIVAHYGIARALITGCLLLTAANLFYGYMADIHPGIWWLTAAISLDNIGEGIAGAAFVAYLSSLTNPAYTATQYALFGTLWSLPAKTVAGFSGRIVDAIGYRSFFVYTALIGLPALLLIIRLMRIPPPESASSAS